MSLLRHEPKTWMQQYFRDYNALQRHLSLRDDESSIDTSMWEPSCDIEETPTHFVIKADLPGVPTKDIRISMENNLLTLEGERQQEEKSSNKNYTRVERVYGSFYRRFSLPNTADASRISATSQHGVLEIKISKKEIAQPRKIEIEERA